MSYFFGENYFSFSLLLSSLAYDFFLPNSCPFLVFYFLLSSTFYEFFFSLFLGLFLSITVASILFLLIESLFFNFPIYFYWDACCSTIFYFDFDLSTNDSLGFVLAYFWSKTLLFLFFVSSSFYFYFYFSFSFSLSFYLSLSFSFSLACFYFFSYYGTDVIFLSLFRTKLLLFLFS